MSSTFHGFNTSRTGLHYSQGHYMISHNMANISTEGYSRQRVDGHAHMPFRLPIGYGYLGTGVDSDFIKQIRNEFLDMRLRREIIHQGEWETRSSYLEHIEMIFNEPSESSFGTTLNEFLHR